MRQRKGLSLIQTLGQDTSSEDFRPQLTSLIDVMTILLVFLIVNFSVEGNLISQPKGLTLPESINKEQALPTYAVQITPMDLRVEDHKVIALKPVALQDSLMIQPLFDAIQGEAKKRAEKKIRPAISIQADKATSFMVLKKVMYTCNRAGFEDFTVLVQRQGGQ